MKIFRADNKEFFVQHDQESLPRLRNIHPKSSADWELLLQNCHMLFYRADFHPDAEHLYED